MVQLNELLSSTSDALTQGVMENTTRTNETLSNSTSEKLSLADSLEGNEVKYHIIIGCLAALSGILICIVVALLLYFKWFKNRLRNEDQAPNVNRNLQNISQSKKHDPNVYENNYKIPCGEGRKEAAAGKKKRSPKQANKNKNKNKNKGDNYVNVEIEKQDGIYEPVDVRDNLK